MRKGEIVMNKTTGSIIRTFDNIGDYNLYVDKKYKYPSSFSNIDPELYKRFTKNNGYLIVVLLVTNKNSTSYTFTNEIFTDKCKGFFLGTLNASRKYLIDGIDSISIENEKLIIDISNQNFSSFEIGILIDTKFSERGGKTLVDFLKMMS